MSSHVGTCIGKRNRMTLLGVGLTPLYFHEWCLKKMQTSTRYSEATDPQKNLICFQVGLTNLSSDKEINRSKSLEWSIAIMQCNTWRLPDFTSGIFAFEIVLILKDIGPQLPQHSSRDPWRHQAITMWIWSKLRYKGTGRLPYVNVPLACGLWWLLQSPLISMSPPLDLDAPVTQHARARCRCG